jgi:hypothetical protein
MAPYSAKASVMPKRGEKVSAEDTAALRRKVN